MIEIAKGSVGGYGVACAPFVWDPTSGISNMETEGMSWNYSGEKTRRNGNEEARKTISELKLLANVTSLSPCGCHRIRLQRPIA